LIRLLIAFVFFINYSANSQSAVYLRDTSTVSTSNITATAFTVAWSNLFIPNAPITGTTIVKHRRISGTSTLWTVNTYLLPTATTIISGLTPALTYEVEVSFLYGGVFKKNKQRFYITTLSP
jgi:hypothetical protein